MLKWTVRRLFGLFYALIWYRGRKNFLESRPTALGDEACVVPLIGPTKFVLVCRREHVSVCLPLIATRSRRAFSQAALDPHVAKSEDRELMEMGLSAFLALIWFGTFFLLIL